MPKGAIASEDEMRDAMSTTEIDIEQQAPASPARSEGEENIEDVDELEELDDLEDIDGDDALEDGLDDDVDGLGDDDADGLGDDGLGDDGLGDDDALGDGAEVLDAVDVVTDGVEVKVVKVATPADPAAEPETDDDDGLADEVEASLDVILAERLRGGDTEVDDEVDDDEEEDDGTPNQLATVIPVRRPEEFLCQSCFLLKPPGQLADPDHQLCRDCA
jgi:hypothetical protein